MDLFFFFNDTATTEIYTHSLHDALPILFAVAAVLLVAGASIASFYLRWKRLRLTEKDTIVLADFVNTTGDSAFDDTLKQGSRVQLEQSPFLNILSDQKASDVFADDETVEGRTADPGGDRKSVV